MNTMVSTGEQWLRVWPAARRGIGVVSWLLACGATPVAAQAPANPAGNTAQANRFLVVDCLLPGEVRRLGAQMSFLTARRASKLPAGECEVRGGEYVAYDRADIRTSLGIWLPLAEKGDREAQTYVGEIFEKGIGGQPDFGAARLWYQKAADQGYPRALMNLGFLYEKGQGVPKDQGRALNLYRQASGLGGLIAVDDTAAAAAAATQDELRSLRQQLDQTRRELDEARRTLDRAKGTNQSELDKLRRERDQAVATGNLAEVKKLEELVRQRESDLEKQGREVGRLDRLVEAYKNQLAKAESERDDARRALAQAVRQLADGGAELDALRAKAARERQAVEGLQRELARLQSSQASTAEDRRRLTALSAELASKTGALESQAAGIRELESELARHKDRLAALQRAESERDEARQQLALANLQLGNANRELDVQRTKAGRDRQEIESIRKELQTLKTSQSASAADKSRLSTLEGELKAKSDALARQEASLRQLEDEVRRYKDKQARLDAAAQTQTAAAPADPALAYAPPSIQLIDPPVVLVRGPYTVKVRGGISTRDLVGRVVAPAGLLSFTVNDRSESTDAMGMFKTKVPVTRASTQVTLVAVDRAGKRATLELTLIGEGAAVEAQVASRKAVDPALMKDAGRYYAVVIGIQDYKELPKLDTSVADAQAVAALLSKRYGFQVTTLLNASRYQILSELNRIRGKLTEKDNLLIYYAGHGELDKTNLRAHWLPIDAEANSDANWISSVALTDLLNAMSAKHVFVVADSCYSGAMTRAAIGQIEAGMSEEARARWLNALAKARSRTVLTSGGVQPVLDGGGGRHSVFAKAFLQVLGDNEDVLEAQRLYREVAARVLDVALNKGKFDQRPEYAPLKFAGHESGDFIFIPTN